MAAFINTNVASLNAQRNLNTSQASLATSLQRLSSGLRINSAKDDAAGLAISERFTSQIRGLDQARRNANDGISFAQTAEGALAASGDMLQRIRELAVQSANSTNSASDRKALQAEASQLTSELDRIASSTEFNGQKILDGSTTSSTFQVGANANQTIVATTANFHTNQYGGNRIGATVASAGSPGGDLVAGSTANAIASSTAAGVNRVAGGNVTINGAAGTATVAVGVGDTAKAAAALINAQTGNTGVTASAKTEFDVTAVTAGSSYALDITSDNSTAATISFTIGAVVNADGLAGAVKAFNDVSSNTGVTAKVNAGGTGITLSNATGNNVTIAAAAGNANPATIAGNATAGGANTIVTGQMTLDSDKSFSVVAANTTDFFTATSSASQVQAVNTIDISSVDGAARAISQIDAALSTVNGQRGNFGALQSRFSSAISNLQTTSENLSAARSRILDTDFAAETASLTRGQILQQAGTAMLAQANSLPNGVLALLRG